MNDLYKDIFLGNIKSCGFKIVPIKWELNPTKKYKYKSSKSVTINKQLNFDFMKLTKGGYVILLGWLLALALVAMSFSSCGASKGGHGCKGTKGYVGY